MAPTEEQLRKDIDAAREQLASAVDELRASIAGAADIGGKLKSKLPVVAGAAASAGFVLAGGIGATARYFARRGREGTERARVGKLSLFQRD
jgi:outer membrane murein-binding lipoprotein Lpp